MTTIVCNSDFELKKPTTYFAGVGHLSDIHCKQFEDIYLRYNFTLLFGNLSQMWCKWHIAWIVQIYQNWTWKPSRWNKHRFVFPIWETYMDDVKVGD